MDSKLCTFTLSKWDTGRGTVNTTRVGRLLSFVPLPGMAMPDGEVVYPTVECIVVDQKTGELFQVSLNAVYVVVEK